VPTAYPLLFLCSLLGWLEASDAGGHAEAGRYGTQYRQQGLYNEFDGFFFHDKIYDL
jgi:hypothetical protein